MYRRPSTGARHNHVDPILLGHGEFTNTGVLDQGMHEKLLGHW